MMLLRRYIGRRLSEYYAQPADAVVGKSVGAESAQLSRLFGEWHWRRLLSRFYQERQGHWLTPVELFQPHFSNILADFCCRAIQNKSGGRNNSKLEIVELGGGRGTNAKHILSQIQATRPDIYNGLTYTLVDSSPSLHQLQKEVFAETDHVENMSFQLLDLLDVAEKRSSLLSPSDTPTVVIAMEVLDNLPHDKIQARTRKCLEQAEIIKSRQYDAHDQEVFVPLQDPLLQRVIKAVPGYIKTYPTWIPSVACGVINHVVHRRPNLTIAFADFDWLPPPDLHNRPTSDEAPSRLTAWGEGEPIITDMSSVDHECFLRAPPHCDILYPTDFDKLGSFAQRTLASMKRKSTVRVEKQSDFLERYGSAHVQNTKSWLTGHSPLLDDFVNCSVLTITTTD